MRPTALRWMFHYCCLFVDTKLDYPSCRAFQIEQGCNIELSFKLLPSHCGSSFLPLPVACSEVLQSRAARCRGRVSVLWPCEAGGWRAGAAERGVSCSSSPLLWEWSGSSPPPPGWVLDRPQCTGKVVGLNSCGLWSTSVWSVKS